MLYRTYRPKRFAQVIGQPKVVRTLRNAVASKRTAHGYLLSGPRGTGKTTLGRILAQAANCASPDVGEPCGECRSCEDFAHGISPHLIELDAASNRGIDDVRSLKDRARYKAVGRRNVKVYLIDEAHMLTEAAANALLRILEEPPRHVIFVLATTDPWKLPATVRSRCHHFSLRPVPAERIAQRLATVSAKERFRISHKPLLLIARQARGSVRDALVLLEQVRDAVGDDPDLAAVRQALGITEDPRVADLAVAACRGNLGRGLVLLRDIQDSGADVLRIQRQIIRRLQDIYRGTRDEEREGALRALRAVSEADCRLDQYSTAQLEIALATCALAASPSGDEKTIILGSRSEVSVDQKRLAKATEIIRTAVIARGYDAVFSVAQEIGLSFGLRWDKTDDQDKLIINMTDLQLVAFAAALRAQKEGTDGHAPQE